METRFLKEAEFVYGTTDDRFHPAVNYLFNHRVIMYMLEEKIKKIKMPNHYDYKQYRLTPNAAKLKFKEWVGKNYCFSN